MIKMKNARALKARGRKRKTAAGHGPTAPQAARSRETPTRAEHSSTKQSVPQIADFTNRNKIMFPQMGITKGNVLDYYERIAPYLLPHLCARPVTLERFPDGLVRPRPTHFWQKDLPAHFPSWIPRVEIRSQDGGLTRYALVNDTPTLLYLVNQGTITFHPWPSRVSSLARPDFVIFDLDPGKASFRDVVIVARHLHSVLDDGGASSFIKTSGKSGVHVLVPWQQEGGYDDARSWADKTAKLVVSALPAIATVERSKSKRQSRVYVDVMQNVRGHHVVPAYTLRAVPEATVSTPLRWQELTPSLDPRVFNLKTIFRRLGKLSADPIADLARLYQC